jgi:tetratricopeptide (TPR) repeat protein
VLTPSTPIPAAAPPAAAQPAQSRPAGFFRERADEKLAANDRAGARRIIEQGLAAHADDAGLTWRLADVELREGKPDRAKQRIVTMFDRPERCDAYAFAAGARLARAAGDQRLAERIVSVGLSRMPLFPELRYQAGVMMSDRKRFKEAAEHLEIAVNLQPGNLAAMSALGHALEQSGNAERAVRVLEYAVPRATPATAFNIHLNLGNALQRLGRNEEGVASYRRAMQFGRPPYIYSNLGAVMRKMHRFAESERAYRTGLMLEPANSGTFYNYGNLLKEIGDLDRSIFMYRRSLAVVGDSASVHWNHALALLAAGRLEDGFREYEWRWKYSGFPTRKREYEQPMWDGKPFPGKTLLLYAEQGMGDHLQFARFIEPVARLGGRVILECHGPLMRLFEHYADKVTLIERLSPPGEFDIQIPLLSVPLVLGVRTPEDLPPAPFLAPPPGFVFPIPEADADRLKVGIIWGGNPEFPGDGERSASLDGYRPLLARRDVQFFCLQKGVREADAVGAPPELIRLNERIGDFCDTASIMRQLDLVITTCTSTAHLAGALGVPTWVLLHHNPDWRWLRHRDDCPWYGSARLFTQQTPGDWAGVFARVDAALGDLVKAR